MMKIPQKWQFKVQNGSKLGQKWRKFSNLSAEMSGSEVKWVKIDESQ